MLNLIHNRRHSRAPTERQPGNNGNEKSWAAPQFNGNGDNIRTDFRPQFGREVGDWMESVFYSRAPTLLAERRRYCEGLVVVKRASVHSIYLAVCQRIGYY